MNPEHKLYHPKWYRTRMPIFWWVAKYSFTKFIARELTSLAVAYSAVFLLVQIVVLSRGEETYERFLGLLQLPPVLIFHGFVLLVLVFHTVTWLNLAPKALVLHVGGRRVPDQAVVASHYLAWLTASGLLGWFLLGR